MRGQSNQLSAILPPLLLLHGGPGNYDHSYLRPAFDRLSSVARVVYVDLPGHGRSPWGDPKEWTLELCADFLPALCESQGITNPVVLGHSMGGMVAMLYGIRHPGHARALILQSTTAHFNTARIVEGFRRVGGERAAAIVAREFGDGLEVTAEEWAPIRKLYGPNVLTNEERARMISNDALVRPGTEQMRRFDVRNLLHKITCPTLICAGDLDPITQVADAEDILNHLRDGLGQLEILDGAGHFPWKDIPNQYWPTLESFIQGLGESK